MTPQFKWDLLIISHFYNKPNASMKYLLWQYEQRYKESAITLGLKRIPKCGKHLKKCVTQFVCQNIPKGKHLWKYSAAQSVDIAEMWEKKGFDTKNHKAEPDLAAVQQAAMAYKAARIADAALFDMKDNVSAHKVTDRAVATKKRANIRASYGV